jgi:hypothetical protein
MREIDWNLHHRPNTGIVRTGACQFAAEELG